MANVLGELFADIADAIREKTGDTATMKPSEFPEKISAIEAGGSAADLRYVTFMSHDGTIEYGKKPVAVGDDCADPIIRGVFDTPTRESTVQYNYTFSGWATEVNGGLNANALKTVEENRTVYANFASVVRYYTITYYDGDGTTVLKTEKLAYGSRPSYTPTKTGYTFTGWDREFEMVTGDTVYYSQWIAKLDFATLTWAQIAQYAESGEAATVFELGAEKTFATKSGTSVIARIIGFNHDDLADGSGKAGITLEMDTPAGNQSVHDDAYASWGGSAAIETNYNKSWDDCSFGGYWNNTAKNFILTGNLPDELFSVMKQVKKKYYDIPNKKIETVSNYLWPVSMSELGFVTSSSLTVMDEGERYAAYAPNKVAGTAYPELIRYSGDNAICYQTRSKWLYGVNIRAIDETGKATTSVQGTSGARLGFAFPCFCI